MGVLIMENNIVEQSMKWIKHLLMKNYHLKAEEADFAIQKSGVKDIYTQDIEMSSHDSIEEWASEVYKFWKSNKA